MSFSVLPASRRIADMVTTAVVLTRKELRGTTWVKTISTPTTALKVTITYPNASGPLQQLSAGAVRWELRYTSQASSWTVRPGAMGPQAEGVIPYRLDRDFWADLAAILPGRR